MITEKEIAQFRKETPGTKKVTHFNNAGCSLPPEKVRRAVIDYLEEEMTCGGYETSSKYGESIEGTYSSIATLLNAKPNEIAITTNATVAWNDAFQAIDWKDGDVIIATRADYASNYISYLHLKRLFNIQIEVIPNTPQGDLDLEAFEKMLNKQVKLVSITHIPTNGGLTVDAEAVGEITQKHGVLYLLDACQSAGQYPLDVNKIGCDMLSATGRKYMRGPRGTGFLYVKESTLPKLTPYWVDLQSAEWTADNEYKIRTDARKFENWEGSRANTLGLKAAAEYAHNIGTDRIWERVQLLANSLRSQLSEIDKVTVQDIGTCKSGLVSFTMEGKEPADIKRDLFNQHINVSTSGASGAFLDMEARGLKEVVRASVHYYNTEDEIEQLVAALKSIK